MFGDRVWLEEVGNQGNVLGGQILSPASLSPFSAFCPFEMSFLFLYVFITVLCLTTAQKQWGQLIADGTSLAD